MPSTSTNRGEEDKFAVVHAGQSGRDGYQVTDHWDEASCQRGCNTVIVEVFFTLLYLLLIQQAHLAPLAVGELIDHRATHIQSHEIVDAGTDIGTEGGKENDQEHVERTTGSMIGCRGDDEL